MKNAGRLIPTLPFFLLVGITIVPAAFEPVNVAVPVPMIENRDQFYGVGISDNAVWAAGVEGKIVRADNVFVAPMWMRQDSGVSSALQAIDAWDAKRVVAVGNDGTIIVTSDAGSTWARVASDALPGSKLVRVRTSSDGVAYAVGEFNTVLRSPDYGQSWERLTPYEDIALLGFDFAGDRLLAAGEFGRILGSRDGGRSWTVSDTPTDAQLTGVASADERRLVAVGLGGTALYTEDGGASWLLGRSGTTEHIYDVIWGGDRFVAAGTRGLLLMSATGAEWHPLASGIQNSRLWFTQIRKVGPRYLVSGKSIGFIVDGRYQDLTQSADGGNAEARTLQ